MKKMIILSMLLGAASLSAQILVPAQWHVKLSKERIQQSDIVELIFSIKLDKNWHLFSHTQNYEIGPLPTTFKFETHDGYILLGDMAAIGAIKHYDPIFEVNVNYFENSAEFRQKIKIISENPMISGTYDYQVCNTIDGKCIMGTDDFEFQLQTIK